MGEDGGSSPLTKSLICLSFSSYYRAAGREGVLTAAVSKVQAAAIASDWLKTPKAACRVTSHPAPPPPWPGAGGTRAPREEKQTEERRRQTSPATPGPKAARLSPAASGILSVFPTPAREGGRKRLRLCLVFCLFYLRFWAVREGERERMHPPKQLFRCVRVHLLN